jgi:hypothetical protein
MLKNDDALYAYITYRNSKQWAVWEVCQCIFVINKKGKNKHEVKKTKKFIKIYLVFNVNLQYTIILKTIIKIIIIVTTKFVFVV